jgi:hypothetical protein
MDATTNAAADQRNTLLSTLRLSLSYPKTGHQSSLFLSSQDCTMSAPGDVPVKLEYRPVFDSLPYHIPEAFEAQNAQQSFSILPGYIHVSFEEQRLRDMDPPPSMATGNVGTITPSALESLRAGYTGRNASTNDAADLLE